MTRCAFVLLALAPVAVAAPVPKDTERQAIEKRYGKVVDPKGDSKFELDGTKLKITLPANQVRDLTQKVDTAPRLTQEVKGDFVLTVRIDVQLDDDALPLDELVEQKIPITAVAGGVQLRPADPKAAWFRYGFSRYRIAGEKVQSGCPCEIPPKMVAGPFGGCGHLGTDGLTGESLTLKYTRKGADVRVVYTTDSKEWKGGVNSVGFLTDETLSVSLFAQHASTKAHTVTFSEFEIKPIEKK